MAEYLELAEPIAVLTVPKSGTHLTANIFRALFGASKVPPMPSWDALPADFGARPAIYLMHCPYSVEMSLTLRPLRKLLQMRDPRDVACSNMRAIFSRKISPHPAQRYLVENGFGSDEVLSFIIQGGRIGETGYSDIGTFFREYHLAWRTTADAVLRYEDLLPDGDDFSRPAAVWRAVLARLRIAVPDGFPLEERVRSGSNPARSATFDRGRSGSWRSDFMPVHHLLLNSVAPRLLADLGYEDPAPVAEPEAMSERRPPPPCPPAEGEAPDRALRREVERLGAMINRVKALDDHVPQRACLMRFDAFNLWILMWRDDAAQIGASWGETGANAQAEALRVRTAAPAVRVPAGTFSPTAEICRAALATHRRVHFVDVGCFYGLETMLVAGLLGDQRQRFAITAFDCGLAGRLAPRSLEFNGFGSHIGFRDEAVTAWDAPMLVFGAHGHLENMRLVNADVAQDTVAYPVNGVRLDTVFAGLEADTKLVVKLHIQGGEFLALEGSRALFESDRIAAIIVAFAPHALRANHLPESLPHYMPPGWRIWDLGREQWVTQTLPQAIDPDGFPAFALGMEDAGITYTMLLLHEGGLKLASSAYFAAARPAI